jgi:predicted O-methyltransferase YrrM
VTQRHIHQTVDWFTPHAGRWLAELGYLASLPIQAIEVGSFEGVSACWLLDNLLVHPGSVLTCIDPWDGLDKLLKERCGSKAERLFDLNTRSYGSKLRKIKDYSLPVLGQMLRDKRLFDLVFVDGNHEGLNALTDLVMGWELLKPGGVLVSDDYEWTSTELRATPRQAYEAFMSMNPLIARKGMLGRSAFVIKDYPT